MSFPGSLIKRIEQGLRRAVALTAAGWAFTAAAALLLALGAARSELAALLWGGSFLLLVVYALAGNGLRRLRLSRHLRRTLDPVECRLLAIAQGQATARGPQGPASGGSLPSGLFPGEEASAEIRAELPRLALPGFPVFFCILLRFQDREPIRLEMPLWPGGNRRLLPFSPQLRGHYRSSAARLEVRDLLGITRAAVALRIEESLRVYPAVHDMPLRPPHPEQGGEEHRRRSLKRRSEELLEVRKYFPGDDIRRVHWKLFAHSNELFLRTGEEAPPPESRYLVLLDTGPSPGLPGELAAHYLDALIEACASCVLALAREGKEVLFAVTDAGVPQPITPEKREEFLAQLSGAWWSRQFRLELPARRRLQVLLFSTPGSVNRKRLLDALSSRAWPVSLFLKDLPAGEPAGSFKSFSWRRQARTLLFAGPRRPTRLYSKAAVQAFQRLLSAELAESARNSRRLVRAARV